MYILYLDASGDPGEYRGRNSIFYVLAGLTCTPDINQECAQRFEQILRSYFPEESGIPRPKKLHYYELIHNKYPYNMIDRLSLSDEIFNLIATSEVTLFAIVIDKPQHWKQYKYPEPPHRLSLEMMMNRYQWFLERERELGLVVSDRESRSMMKTLLDLFEKFKREGTNYKELRNIIDTIFFTPSGTSVPLQMTDSVAYAVFKKYQHGNDDLFDKIRRKFNAYGLKEFP